MGLIKLSRYWMDRHEDYNHEYFDGALAAVPVYTGLLRGCWGYFVPTDMKEEKVAHIVLSTELTHHQKGNILLHEMCHQATPEPHYHHHSPAWKRWMRRCGFKGRITRYTGRYKEGGRS